MKSDKSILLAFLLNLLFAIFELIGGVFTGSIAILSDSIHDLGDAMSIGASYFFEKKSKHGPDEIYSFGYLRYSVIGALITNTILLLGSILVIYNAVLRIISPSEINYSGMLVFSIIGIVVNLFAARITNKGDSLNQKAVNLHMIEDVLGWIAVLIGAIVIKFTNLIILDPILSIGIAVFVVFIAIAGIKKTLNILLEKTPCEIKTEEIKKQILALPDVIDVHHIHIWSLDDKINCATMHIVSIDENEKLKSSIKEELLKHGIFHTTLEFEKNSEICPKKCDITSHITKVHSQHRHHHH